MEISKKTLFDCPHCGKSFIATLRVNDSEPCENLDHGTIQKKTYNFEAEMTITKTIEEEET